MTRMKPGSDLPDHLVFLTAIHSAFRHLAGTPINNFLPLRFRIGIHCGLEAGDKLAGQKRTVFFRQGQHFGDLFNGDAHAAEYRFWEDFGNCRDTRFRA